MTSPGDAMGGMGAADGASAAFQAALENRGIADTGALKRLSAALRASPPPSPPPLAEEPPGLLMTGAPPSTSAGGRAVPVRSGRRRHARTHYRRHRGMPARRGRHRPALLVVLPVAGALGLLLALLR
ncbi:hypothetical protein [Streptomyces klenkii]|uniref:hypothetical protein n=1 Tax=Streptomyces klenkii TaxID=1420899 RepID=UPI003446876A